MGSNHESATAPKVLALPAYRRLLVSYLLNELGDNVGLIALTVLVFGETGSIWATTGLYLVGRFLPALISPAVAAHLERFPARHSLPVLYLSEALIFGGLAAVAHANFSLLIVLVLSAADAVIALTARSLSRATMAAALQPSGQIREGNALMSIALGVASAAGLALGGFVISGTNITLALEINAASFVVVAAIAASPKLGGAPPELPESAIQRLRAGFSFIRNSDLHRTVLALEALAIVLFTMVVPIEVAWVREHLNAGSGAFGAVMALWCAGILAGGLLFARVGGSVAILALMATGLIGAAHTGMGLTSSVVIACVIAPIGGVGNGMQWVAVTTLLQERTPPDMQARLSAFVESLSALMIGVGFVVGGLVASLTSPATTIVVSGVVLLALVGALAVRVPAPLAVADAPS